MPEEKNEAVEPEVMSADNGGDGELARVKETTDRLTQIRSLLPSLPPSATEFFLSLWIARRDVKSREAAAAVVRAERELLAEYILREQALQRASELPLILATDRIARQQEYARRRREYAETELAALQAEARLEAFKKAQESGGSPQEEAKPKRTRADVMKHRLFEEAQTTVELQMAAEEEIKRIDGRVQRGEIAQDRGERLIENIRDTLEKLLEEL